VAAAAISLLIACSLFSRACRKPRIRLPPLEGVHHLLPMGPVASQEAIKMLGTNGGGSLTPTHRTRLKTRPR
jgi:K+-transporting ATPase ATPase A chain